jgi:hypothetical protein
MCEDMTFACFHLKEWTQERSLDARRLSPLPNPVGRWRREEALRYRLHTPHMLGHSPWVTTREISIKPTTALLRHHYLKRRSRALTRLDTPQRRSDRIQSPESVL